MNPFMTQISNELKELQEKGQYRILRTLSKIDGKRILSDRKEFINLSSNDYLGLASDSSLLEEFVDHIQKNNLINDLGMSSTSSRLLTGNHSAYKALEDELARLFNREAALVFNSGYHANTGIIEALCKKDDLIVSDKLNHASMIDGIKLSGADFYRFNHLNYDHLEKILKEKRAKYKNVFILTESVFSMDGDMADLKRLVELKEKYDCVLYVDEAHSCGVLGNNGLGLAEETGMIAKIDILVGTFGKAFASLGAFCVCDQALREYLINFMRPFIFTTALAPVNLNWSLFILKKIPSFKDKRKILRQISDRLRHLIRQKGYQTAGNSQIIPLILGENEKALKVAARLQENGFFALPVRPPTVPKGTARIRFSLSAALDMEDIEKLGNFI